MKRSTRLKPVAMQATQSENNAARQLGDDSRTLEDQKKRLQELLSYREQYLSDYQQAGNRGLNAIQLREYQLFIARLDGVIEQQKKQVELGLQQHEKSQHTWLEARGRAGAIDKVIDGHRHRERDEAMRREQREIDDRPHRATGTG